jgi:Uma2 family endonuclease
MSTSPLNLVSENEYLHTPYRPDCDYVDGFVLERNLGQHDHARLQGLILYWLMQHEMQWQIHALPECRLKIRSGKYRVPDVMVLPVAGSYPPVIEQPPLLCIEVVSPDDRLADLVTRAGDYLTLGVPITWIFDPKTKQSFIYSDQGTVESFDPILRRGLIELPIAELFTKL